MVNVAAEMLRLLFLHRPILGAAHIENVQRLTKIAHRRRHKIYIINRCQQPKIANSI
jgi:hypothetical protein